MNRAAFFLSAFLVSLGADEGVKSPVSIQVAEGKSVYVPVKLPIDLSKEAQIQERDQNPTRHGFQT